MSDYNQNGLELFKKEEDIAAALDSFDQETLKETLAYLLKIYVIDKEVGYDGVVQDGVDSNVNLNEVARGSNSKDEASSFYELINSCKNRYKFKELDLFSVEDGKVYVEIDGNKQLLRSVGSTPPVAPPNRGSGFKAEQPAKKSPPTPPSNTGTGTASSRFSNLEMD